MEISTYAPRTVIVRALIQFVALIHFTVYDVFSTTSNTQTISQYSEQSNQLQIEENNLINKTCINYQSVYYMVDR